MDDDRILIKCWKLCARGDEGGQGIRLRTQFYRIPCFTRGQIILEETDTTVCDVRQRIRFICVIIPRPRPRLTYGGGRLVSHSTFTFNIFREIG